jgi:hypothetical protein
VGLAACAASGGDGGGGGGGGGGGTGCVAGMGSGSADEFSFVVPYQDAPLPATRDVEAPAKIARADVAILLDTSGSMLGTDTRIQGEFQKLVTMLAGTIDDLAFGAAGIGDFPINDGANSQYDVPYYLVHRIMTARTADGLASLVDALQYKSIITSGLGPWFAGMRGGDEPEQGWEALRQASTGIGLTFPDAFTGTETVPAFDPATAYPQPVPAGEEVGTIGGMGFRDNSLPILMIVTDTTQHDTSLTTTTPHSADHVIAEAALAQIGARVIGINTYFGTGDADLQMIATATGAHVAPEAWGTGSARPANCPVGSCCVIADDPELGPATQPLPVNGECNLVFRSDKYDTQLSAMLAQAITAVARGVRFDAGAVVVDDPSDDVDTTQFVDHVEAIAAGDCAGAQVSGDHFVAVVPGTNVCFRIVAKSNTTVPAASEPKRYHARLVLTGNGMPTLAPIDVWFVVPTTKCDDGGGVIQ